MKKYPKQIYVQRDNEGTQDEYLRAETETIEFEDGAIGIYELKEMKKKRTEIHLD